MSEGKFTEKLDQKGDHREKIEDGLRLIAEGKTHLGTLRANLEAAIETETEGLSVETRAKLERAKENISRQIGQIEAEIEKIARVVTDLAQSLGIEINLDEILQPSEQASQEKEAA
ncbi:MAG: hypothetical protein COU85_00110 [Candidatus Portnoybacteria bacterium CG10_big_fil_rev_8_21_14_0_10_44_7]|uniref:Uncharacterized protein n=1 Tax=Candidatus Portnoybacteria bacterium CG10_big_fil_rev_8_21_14_0_10_44_7 TaxID=1974816 RepID=A0A2M8KJL2_9BACT|nr:MAG: hypothetical protein COU85_00110 [Candidatus Portnoybacteria bacterium CG10_big_fil_rev_8_21_14_0_10_44_7]